jgi:DEAD/DEAH box helicase domain-containing protein
LPPLEKLLAGRPHLVSRYDGATKEAIRGMVRDQVQIALTNPDMLHVGILQHHERHWSRFFGHLEYVILDECHEYRGIFGTNVAYMLRRLRQICELNGSSPTFIATSATIHHPQEHLEKLTGLPFCCVGPESDGSMQGRKKFWIVSGPEHYYDLGRKLALDLARRGLSVLAFCPSRIAAERMLASVRSSKDDELPFVRVYRAGLSAQERESIEAGLRDRSVRLVFSTSALELGIDIGELDAVVCVGLPSSMMSLWQRAGRVARGGKEGAIILIPADTPIDSYYAAHPEELFAKENEPLALDLHNRRVVHCHYACAVKEVGGIEDRLRLGSLGETMRQVGKLRSDGVLNADIFYRSDPHMTVNIRSMGEGSYTLRCRGEEIGQIDDFHLLREAYRNAIYRHGGVPYRVKDVIKGKRLILLERDYSGHDTRHFVQKQIRLKGRRAVAEYAGLTVATVRIDVTEFLLSVVERDRSGKVVRQWQGSAGMPANTLPTEGTLLHLGRTFWDAILGELDESRAKSALTSCERLIASLFPTISGPCDTQDYSSFSEVQKDGSAVIYLYDMVYDGVELTTAAFDMMGQLIDKSLERLTTCDCTTDEGCFRCIANPRVEEKSSKEVTARLLRILQRVIGTETPKVIPPAPDSTADLAPDAKASCPACNSSVAQGDRFCRNCGEELA